jgi:hypothetical protein
MSLERGLVCEADEVNLNEEYSAGTTEKIKNIPNLQGLLLD